MAYSTKAEFRGNVSMGEDTDNISDPIVDARIAVADKTIQTDLSNVISFTSIVATPSFLNILAQYKTAELCLVWMYGKQRNVEENSDVDYWIQKYNDLLELIKAGGILLVDGSDPAVGIGKTGNTFSNTARDDIQPALGAGKWGDFETKATKETNRPVT